MALANAAQSEALELGAYNKELLFPYQRDIILKNEEILKKQHSELELNPPRWFGHWGPDRSKKHLEDSQEFLTRVKATVKASLEAYLRRELSRGDVLLCQQTTISLCHRTSSPRASLSFASSSHSHIFTLDPLTHKPIKLLTLGPSIPQIRTYYIDT
ncbi:hypothetical protein PAXINDRAFT_8677 [Paxillus involutus ATCC 200175]|nr:hypothetical protein PAXINDRAFT_8677 [Paxillus involutus ATCC 200175]